jgi:TrmH family RNA methyltransferase
VEGRSLVTQAIDAGWSVESQYVPDGVDPVSSVAPAFVLGPNVLDRVASTDTPQPLLAVVSMRSRTLPEGSSFVLAAHQVADPGNAGTIIRSAEAAGADAVVLTPGSVDMYNPKVVRSAAGSLFRLPVIEADLDALGHAGLRVLATSSHRGDVYTDVDLRGPVALVVGNEAHGVPEDALVDGWITIPHSGAAESLNVAMAATLLAFEVARQRR